MGRRGRRGVSLCAECKPWVCARLVQERYRVRVLGVSHSPAALAAVLDRPGRRAAARWPGVEARACTCRKAVAASRSRGRAVTVEGGGRGATPAGRAPAVSSSAAPPAAARHAVRHADRPFALRTSAVSLATSTRASSRSAAAASRAASVAAWRLCSSRRATRSVSSFFNSSFSDAWETARDAGVPGELAGLASPALSGTETPCSQSAVPRPSRRRSRARGLPKRARARCGCRHLRLARPAVAPRPQVPSRREAADTPSAAPARSRWPLAAGRACRARRRASSSPPPPPPRARGFARHALLNVQRSRSSLSLVSLVQGIGLRGQVMV